MNLTRALDVALPEIPAQTLTHRYPRPDPNLTYREHVEDGEPVVRIYSPARQGMYTFPRPLWEMIRLFDGKRSYEEIAELYSEQQSPITPDEVRDIADNLSTGDFWYTTPQERNILLMQQTAEMRRKKVKKQDRFADLSVIIFPAFNPDKVVTWVHNHTRFFYSAWFTVLSLIAFAFTAGLTIGHWREIGRDTLEFYTFSTKSWSDIGVIYLIAMFVVAIHEFGHAHACKHYGGRVPAMGFALVYLTPAFYTDTTEGAVKGSRFERLIISLAGIWIELLVCSIATPIWWLTQPGTAIHLVAYFLLMLTGITSLLINWNPLMKLDGYYMLCETIGIADLKEDSTAYVAAWLKRHIWGLPVEVPYVRKGRRLGFVVYALSSGLYSYTVLYIVARFAGNLFRSFSPEWAFIPQLAAAALIFRSRIRLFLNFCKFVYLDKKGKMLSIVKSGKFAAACVIAAAILLPPFRNDSATGRFVLEPSSRAVVRAQIAGMVTSVHVEEGQPVAAGDLLIEMRNVPLQSRLARGEADYIAATGKVKSSGLRYAGLGPALMERDRVSQQQRELVAEASQLKLTSPIAGVVVTPRASDHLGAYVVEGSELVEVAVNDPLKARIYIPEYEMHRFELGAPARLQVQGLARTWDAYTVSMAPASSDVAPGLAETTAYKGLNPPQYYAVELSLANPDGRLKPGMIGSARVYGARRSLLGLGWQSVSEFVRRKVW